MNFAIIFNDGNLSYIDFQKECRDEGWLPITVLRKDGDDNTYVPIFIKCMCSRHIYLPSKMSKSLI